MTTNFEAVIIEDVTNKQKKNSKNKVSNLLYRKRSQRI